MFQTLLSWSSGVLNLVCASASGRSYNVINHAVAQFLGHGWTQFSSPTFLHWRLLVLHDDSRKQNLQTYKAEGFMISHWWIKIYGLRLRWTVTHVGAVSYETGPCSFYIVVSPQQKDHVGSMDTHNEWHSKSFVYISKGFTASSYRCHFGGCQQIIV